MLSNSETEIKTKRNNARKIGLRKICNGGVMRKFETSRDASATSCSSIATTSTSTRSYSIVGKTPQQVQRRNERERRRVQAVNHGYEILAQQLADWDELKDKKLTKAQTLKAAILYIQHMQNLLGSSTTNNNNTINRTNVKKEQLFFEDIDKSCNDIKKTSPSSYSITTQQDRLSKNTHSNMAANYNRDNMPFEVQSNSNIYANIPNVKYARDTLLSSSSLTDSRFSITSSSSDYACSETYANTTNMSWSERSESEYYIGSSSNAYASPFQPSVFPPSQQSNNFYECNNVNSSSISHSHLAPNSHLRSYYSI